ncbi:hypothetical protein SAMD00019534_117520, partial [Acytostelium subglobosum LB1]|uniref:hypothetical protein n=1 Tax=Acytostelium subglobosum LB1 TaxID=1410327 RepID=UPI000644ACF6
MKLNQTKILNFILMTIRSSFQSIGIEHSQIDQIIYKLLPNGPIYDVLNSDIVSLLSSTISIDSISPTIFKSMVLSTLINNKNSVDTYIKLLRRYQSHRVDIISDVDVLDTLFRCRSSSDIIKVMDTYNTIKPFCYNTCLTPLVPCCALRHKRDDVYILMLCYNFDWHSIPDTPSLRAMVDQCQDTSLKDFYEGIWAVSHMPDLVEPNEVLDPAHIRMLLEEEVYPSTPYLLSRVRISMISAIESDDVVAVQQILAKYPSIVYTIPIDTLLFQASQAIQDILIGTLIPGQLIIEAENDDTWLEDVLERRLITRPNIFSNLFHTVHLNSQNIDAKYVLYHMAKIHSSLTKDLLQPFREMRQFDHITGKSCILGDITDDGVIIPQPIMNEIMIRFCLTSMWSITPGISSSLWSKLSKDSKMDQSFIKESLANCLNVHLICTAIN